MYSPTAHSCINPSAIIICRTLPRGPHCLSIKRTVGVLALYLGLLIPLPIAWRKAVSCVVGRTGLPHVNYWYKGHRSALLVEPISRPHHLLASEDRNDPLWKSAIEGGAQMPCFSYCTACPAPETDSPNTTSWGHHSQRKSSSLSLSLSCERATTITNIGCLTAGRPTADQSRIE